MSTISRLVKRKEYMLALTLMAAIDWASGDTAFAADIEATALPTGERIHQTNGVPDVSINRDEAAHTMKIEQDKNIHTALIDWQSFDVGSSATINILQHRASDTLINNVIGNNLSTINGRINATGNVVLINPNGIVFDGAQINVGGFLASTAPVSINFDSKTNAITSYKILENSPFQGNIKIANSMIAAGYSRITTNTALSLPKDFAYDISSLTNQVRVYADGDISLNNSKIFANDYTNVITSKTEGVESWDLGDGNNWVSGKAVLRTDMNGDDLGSLTVSGTNTILGRETRLIYNPALVEEPATTSDGKKYTKKNFNTELDVTAINNNSKELLGTNFTVRDNVISKSGQRSAGGDINAYMLINNMAQLQDIDDPDYGNLNGNYVLGRTLDGAEDALSYVTTGTDGKKYVHKTYDKAYSDYNGNTIAANTNLVANVLSTNDSYYTKNGSTITKTLTNGTNFKYNVDPEGNYAITEITIKKRDEEGKIVTDNIISDETGKVNVNISSKGIYTFEFPDGGKTFTSENGKEPTVDGEREISYKFKKVDNVQKYEDGEPLFDDDDKPIMEEKITWEPAKKTLKCTYTFHKDGTITYKYNETFSYYEPLNPEEEPEKAVEVNIDTTTDHDYNVEDDTEGFKAYTSKLIEVCTQLMQLPKNSLDYVKGLNAESKAFDGSSVTNSQKWNEGKGFKPIGNNVSEDGTPLNPFTGTLTGYIGRSAYVSLENQINNLYINRPDEDNVGLFGVVSSEIVDGKYATKPDGTVLRRGYLEALNLQDAYITGKSNVGALAGQMTDYSYMYYGNTTNSNAAVKEGTHTGEVTDTTGVVRSTANGTPAEAKNVGGLVGIVKDLAYIKESYNRSTVVGQNDFVEDGNIKNIGGIVGAVDGSAYMKKLEYIYSDEKIEAMKADTEKKEILDGYRAHIKDVRNYGNVFGEKAVGGILGYASDAQLDATVDNTYYSYVISNNSQVNGYDYVGGLVGQIGSNIHINKAFNSNESAAGASNNYGTTSSIGNSIITGNAESIKEQIKKTSTYGQVTGHSYVGGLIGGSTFDSTGNKINNAYNAANVIATGDYVGGIAGYFSGAGSSITNAYNGDNNTIIRELFPIMDGETGAGTGVSQGKNDKDAPIKNLDDLLNSLVTNHVGLNSDEDTPEHYILKYYAEAPAANKADIKNKIGDLISYYSFKTIDNEGNSKYYYYIPTAVGDGADRMGAEGIYVDANGQRVDEDKIIAIDFNSRIYAIREAYRDANITGISKVGGLVGGLDKGAVIDTTYNAGSVTGDTVIVGAIAGEVANSAKIKDSFFVTGTDISTGKNFSNTNNHVGDSSSGTVDSTVRGSEITNLRSGNEIKHVLDSSDAAKKFFDPQSMNDSKGNPIYQLKYGSDTHYLYLSENALNVDDPNSNMSSTAKKVVQGIQECMEALKVSKKEYDIYEDKDDSEQIFAIIRLQKKDEEGHVVKDENGKPEIVIKIFGLDQLKGTDTASGSPSTPPGTKDDLLKAEYGLSVASGDIISNQGDTWTVYGGQTLPLLNIFMNNADIAREFEYDGTIHNLVTDDVSGVYGRADFLGGAGKNVYTKGYEEMSDNGLSSHYYLDNSNIWAPQHGLRVSPTASVVINPIGLNITVEGEKIYGMHMLQGYYVSVPIYNSLKELVRYDYYKIGTREGSTIEEHTSVDFKTLEEDFKVTVDGDKSNKDLWKEEDWREYNNKIKNAILNNHHYVVTMDGFVNSETIESSLGGLVNFVTNNTADNLSGSSFKAAFDDQKLGVADTNFTFKYTDENGNEVEKKYYNEDSGAYDLTGSLGGITARYNNYKINYEGYLKVDKASIAYTYDGERDYGAANESGTHSWYINGIDTNSTALSVNGQLKDWDALKLLETNLIKAQIDDGGEINSVTFEYLRGIGAIKDDVNGTYTFNLSAEGKIIDKDDRIVKIENFTINSDNFKISDRGNLIMMSSENDKINISANYNDNGTINSYTIKNIEDNTEQTIYVKETKAETVLYTDFTAGGDKNGADLYTNPLTTGSTITQKLLKAGALTYDPGSSQYLIKESAFDETGTSVTGINGAGNILTTITANGEEGKKHYYACNTSGDGVGFWIEKGAGDEPDKFYEYVTPEDYTNKKELSTESKLLLVNFGVINEAAVTGNQKFNNAFYTQDGSSIESYAKEFVNKDTGGILLKNYSDDSYNNFTNYVVSDYTGKVISDLYQKTTENEITLYSDADHKTEINSSNNTMQYIVGIGTANDLYHVLTKENNDGNRVVSDYTLSYLGTDFELVKTDDVSEQSFKTLQNTLSNYNFDWRMGGTYGMLSSRADQKAYGTTDIKVKDSYETIKPIELEVNVSGSRDYLNTMKNDQFTVSNGGEGHTLVTAQDTKGDDITGAQNFTWNFDFGRVEGTGDDKHIVNGLTGDDNNRKETILSFDNVKALTEALEGDTVTITIDDKSEEVKRINANTFVKRGTDGTVTVYNLTKHDDNTEGATSYKGSLFDVSQMFVVNSDTNLLEFNGKYYDVSHKDNDPDKELDTINTVFKYGDNKGILSDANKYDYLIKAPENNAYTLEVKPVQLSMDITVNGSRYYGQHTSQNFADTNSYNITAVDKTNTTTGAIKIIDGLYYVFDGTVTDANKIDPVTGIAKGWVKLADNIALQNNLGYDKDGNKLTDYGQTKDAGTYTNSKAEGVKLTDTYDKTTGKLVNVISIQEKDGYTNGISGTVATTGSNGSIANNYNISGLDATYKIEQAKLYYILSGYREYGEANETGIYQYELSGIDKDSEKESVNGFLKSFDVDKISGVAMSAGGAKATLALDTTNDIAGAVSYDFTLADGNPANASTNVMWGKDSSDNDTILGYELKSVSGIRLKNENLNKNYELVLLDNSIYTEINTDGNPNKLSATKVATTDGTSPVQQENLTFKYLESSNENNLNMNTSSEEDHTLKHNSSLYITPVEVQLSVQGQRYYGNAMKEVTKSSNFTVNANASSLGNGIFNVTAQHKEDANTFLAALGVSENYTGTTTSSKINFWSSSSLQTAYGKEADDSYSIYKKLNSIENNGTDKSITNATKVKLDADGNVLSYNISTGSTETDVTGSEVNLAKNAGNYVFYDITGSSLKINKRKVYYTIDGSRTYGDGNDTDISKYNLSFRDPKGNTGFATVDIANSDGKLTTDNIAVMKEALDITLGFDAYSSAGEYKSGEIISTKSKDSSDKTTASVTAEYTDAFYGKGSNTTVSNPTMSVSGLEKMFSYDINGQSTGLKNTINTDNYEIIGTHNFTINKRDITVTTKAERDYGEVLFGDNSNTKILYEVSGKMDKDVWNTTSFVTTEKEGLASLDANTVGYTGSSKGSGLLTTTFKIDPDDAFINNYKINEGTYTFKINPAKLTIDITGSKIYGDGTYTTGDGYSFKIYGLKNNEQIDILSNTDTATDTAIKGSAGITIDTSKLLDGIMPSTYTDENGKTITEDNLAAGTYTSAESKGLSISNLYADTLSIGKDEGATINTGFNANNYSITTTSSFTVDKKKLMYKLSGVKTYGDTSTGAINWTAGLIDGYRLAHIDVGTKADLALLGKAISTNIISSVKTDVDEGVIGSKKYVFAGTYNKEKETSTITKDDKPYYNVTTKHTENEFTISVEMNKDDFTNLIKNKSGNTDINLDNYELYGQHTLTVNKRDLELNTTAERVYGDKGNLTNISHNIVNTDDNTVISHDLGSVGLSTILTTNDNNTNIALDVNRDENSEVIAYVSSGDNVDKYITTQMKDGIDKTNDGKDTVFSNYNIVQKTNSLTVTPKDLTIEVIGTKTYGEADADKYYFKVDGLVNDEKIGAELSNYTGETGRTATDLHVINTITDSDAVGYNSGSYLDAGKYNNNTTDDGVKPHTGELTIDKLFADLSVGKDSADTVTAGFNANNYNITQNYQFTVTPKTLDMTISGSHTYGDTTVNTDSGQMITDGSHFYGAVKGFANNEVSDSDENKQQLTGVTINTSQLKDTDAEGKNTGSYLNAGHYTSGLTIDNPNTDTNLATWLTNLGAAGSGTNAGFKASNYQLNKEHIFTDYAVDKAKLNVYIVGKKLYGEESGSSSNSQTKLTDNGLQYSFAIAGLKNGEQVGIGTSIDSEGLTADSIIADMYNGTKGGHIANMEVINNAKDNDADTNYNSGKFLNATVKHNADGSKEDTPYVKADGESVIKITEAAMEEADRTSAAPDFLANNYEIESIDSSYTVDKRTLNITVQANREYGALNDDGTNANKYSYTTSDIVGDENAPDMLLFKDVTSGAVTTDSSAWNLSTGTYGYNEGNTDKKSMALQQDTDGYFTSGEYLNTRWNNTEAITKLYDNYVIPTFTEKLVIDKAKLYINITGNKIYGESTGTTGNAVTLYDKDGVTGLVHRQYSFDISGLAHKDGVWDTIGNFTDGTNLQDANGVFELTNTLKNASGRELISHTIPGESGGESTTIYQANLNYNPDGYSSDSDGNNLIKISNLASVFNGANGDTLDKNYEIINSSFYNVAKRRVNIGVTATRDYGSTDLRDISCGIEEQNIDTSTGIMTFENGYADVIKGNSTPTVTDKTSLSLDVGTHSVTGDELVADFDYDVTNKDLGDTLLENYVVNKDSHELHVKPVNLEVKITGSKTYGDEASYQYKYTFSGLKNDETIAGIGNTTGISSDIKVANTLKDNDAVYYTGKYLDVGNYTSDSVSILNKFDSVKISNWDNLSTTDSTSVEGFNAKNYNIITNYDFTVNKAQANINITGSKTYGEDTQSKGYTISLGLKNGETAGQSQWVSDVTVDTSGMVDSDTGVDSEGTVYNSGKYLDAGKYENKLSINSSDIVDEINKSADLKENNTGFKTSNYDFSSQTSEYTVNKKDLAIGITGNKTYGAATAYDMGSYSAKITGLVGDENINLTGNSSAVVTNEASDGKDGKGFRDTYLDAGIYKDTIKISDDVLNANAQNTFKTSNYYITQNSTYTVGKKDMVLTTTGERTYGVAAGKDLSTVNDDIVYSYSADGLLADDEDVFEASKKSTNNTTVATTAAGKYGTKNGGEQVLTTAINDNSAANSITKNYNIKAKDDFTIDKAKLSVAVEGNKVYGSDLVKYNINIDGLRNGETVGSDVVNNAVDSDIDGYNKGVFLDAGRYGDISAEDTHDSDSKLLNLTGLWKKDTGTGYDFNNYEVVSYKDQLNVGKAQLNINISGNKTYGEATAYDMGRYSAEITGLVGDENIELTGNSTAKITNSASDGKDGNGVRDTYLDVGTYTDTVNISDDVLNANAKNTFKTSNYNITQNSVYTVGKKDMVLTTAGERTYGVAAGKDVSTVNDGIVYSYSADGLLDDDKAVFESADKSTENITTAVTYAGKHGTENGGEQVLFTTVNDNSANDSITKNYTISSADDFTVNKAKLSVSVEGNKVYGSDLVKYNINIDGLRNGETIGSDIVNNAVDSDIDGYNKGVFLDAGRYGDISAEDISDSDSKLLNLTGLWKKDTGSGYDFNNYEVVSYKDQLNVAKAPLSIDISGEKISGEETSAKFKDYNVTISGLQNGETIFDLTDGSYLAKDNKNPYIGVVTDIIHMGETAPTELDPKGTMLMTGHYYNTMFLPSYFLPTGFKPDNYEITQTSHYEVKPVLATSENDDKLKFTKNRSNGGFGCNYMKDVLYLQIVGTGIRINHPDDEADDAEELIED